MERYENKLHSIALSFLSEQGISPNIYADQIIRAVKYGANWQKKQLMKDAVELTIKEGQHGEPYLIFAPDVEARNLKCGDKVKIIMIKED